MNPFVLLSMRSSNQRFLNQLRMRIPGKILLHQLLVSSPFTIMLIGGTLILPEMCSLGTTSVRERTCLRQGTSDRPVELEKIAQLRKTFVTFEDKTEQVIEDDWKTFDDPKRALDKFWKGRTEFTLISAPTGKRLRSKQSTLPVVQDLSKSKSSRLASTSADQRPTSDSAMFESHPVNPSRQLLEELAVAGVNIEQVKEILFSILGTTRFNHRTSIHT